MRRIGIIIMREKKILTAGFAGIMMFLFSVNAFSAGDPRAMKAGRGGQSGQPQGQSSQPAKKQVQYVDIDQVTPVSNKVYTQPEINALAEELNVSSEKWSGLDTAAKTAVTAKFIDMYAQKGIKISKPPAQYAAMFDSMTAQNPQMLSSPFSRALEVLAVIEYDLDNGQDKDAMARKVLGGEKAYLNNRKRLGLD